MNKLSSCIQILFFLFLCSCTTLNHPFLYELEKDHQTSFIFGSQHVGIPYGDLPSSVMDAFDSSDFILVEQNIVVPEDEDSFVDNHPELYWNPAEPSITSQLNSRQRQMLKRMWPAKLEKVSPDRFSAYGVLKLLTDERKFEVSRYRGYEWDPKEGIDLNLIQRAIAKNKIVQRLDSRRVNDQLSSCLGGGSLILLKKLLDHPNQAPDEEYWSSADYRSGDEKRIVQLLKNDPMSECLLTERNQWWLETIETASERLGKSFTVVGAAHLFAGPGLLDLLRRDGFTIRRIEK